MSSDPASQIRLALSSNEAINHSVHEKAKLLSYGTAGFRSNADILDGIAFRCGLVVALKSKLMNGLNLGLMLTASHNPPSDNGVKLVEPDGEMLVPEWENITVQCVRSEDLVTFLTSLVQANKINLCNPDDKLRGQVFLGWDSRISSPTLAASARHGIEAMGARCISTGLITTPQLHYLVKYQNKFDPHALHRYITVSDYYDQLSNAFRQLSRLWPESEIIPIVHVDCANGVGASGIRPLVESLKDKISIQLHNTVASSVENDRLNLNCGADFVKTKVQFPELLDGTSVKVGEKWASFDGDADRLVYYYRNQAGNFQLLDGDRLATLFAGYLMSLLSTASNNKGQSGSDLSIGLVQTAYANAASTRYIEEILGVPVACVPTGVKHLHHKAKEFDVGVYFEANGHGTVIFSDRAREFINSLEAGNPLRLVLLLINDAVGDAISDLLMTEHILAVKPWNLEQWASAYQDLPSCQLIVRVKDRNVITTKDADRKVANPPELQKEIDIVISAAKSPYARSFVRPSGTEDVVRVYAEHETIEKARELAVEVGKLVYRLIDGLGPEPSLE